MLWSSLNMHQQEWRQHRLIPFILSLYFISLKILCPTSLFRLCHRHQQRTTPPWFRRAYNFLQLRLHPTSNKANLLIMTSPAAANLSVQLPQFHRHDPCLRLAASNKDLVPPGDILTAAGGRLLLWGSSSAVDSDRTGQLLSVRRLITSVYFHLLSQGL